MNETEKIFSGFSREQCRIKILHLLETSTKLQGQIIQIVSMNLSSQIVILHVDLSKTGNAKPITR